MKGAIAVIIGFVHDFAAGCWAASVVAIWYLNRQAVGLEAAEVMSNLEKLFFFGGLVCVFVVFATGAGRTFTYVPNVYGQEDEGRRRKLLIYKHILLLVVFVSGVWWQYSMAFG